MEQRVRQAELMDAPDLNVERHRQALRGLARVNRISSTATVLWRAMRRYARPGRPFRLLDVGCGAGDVLVDLARRAARHEIELYGVGCDVSNTAIQHARDLATNTAGQTGLDLQLEFLTRDCLRHELPSGFDVVMSSLFLHHLSDDDACRLLVRLRGATRQAVLVDDLCRSWRGYALAWMGTRLLSRSSIVHVDGPISVRAAFRVGELRELAERAGLASCSIRRHWPCRMLLSWSVR